VKKLLTFVAALVVCTAAYAATYYGWNPATNLETTHGVQIDGGTVLPVITGACGTRSAQLGGADTGQFTAGAVTTCTTTLTFLGAAPNGYFCFFQDLTTPADTIRQASYTTTSCTSQAATIVSGDVVMYSAVGF
jgi:hypothetical protein